VRKIFDEINIFEGITKNPLFIIIWLIITGGQAIIIEVGSRAFKVADGGLPYPHWIIAIGCGFLTWIVAIFIK
jgi:hypothetical protein